MYLPVCRMGGGAITYTRGRRGVERSGAGGGTEGGGGGGEAQTLILMLGQRRKRLTSILTTGVKHLLFTCLTA